MYESMAFMTNSHEKIMQTTPNETVPQKTKQNTDTLQGTSSISSSKTWSDCQYMLWPWEMHVAALCRSFIWKLNAYCWCLIVWIKNNVRREHHWWIKTGGSACNTDIIQPLLFFVSIMYVCMYVFYINLRHTFSHSFAEENKTHFSVSKRCNKLPINH